jgi:hypothetical protein
MILYLPLPVEIAFSIEGQDCVISNLPDSQILDSHNITLFGADTV